MEIALGLFVMFLTWVVYRIVLAIVLWLCNESNIIRTIVQVIGVLCGISVIKHYWNKNDKD